MIGRGFWIEWCSVHEFKGPSPYVEGHIITPQLSLSLHHATQSDMGKWAPHICIDLDSFHTASLRRRSHAAWASERSSLWSNAHNDVIGFLLFRYACLPHIAGTEAYSSQALRTGHRRSNCGPLHLRGHAMRIRSVVTWHLSGVLRFVHEPENVHI